MMKKKYFFCSLLFLAFFFVKGQDDRELCGEKVYLTTDRSVYGTCDTIRIKGFVVDDVGHLPENTSRFLYVELLDMQDRVLVRQKMMRGDKGFGTVLPLANSLLPGNYFLRGYTRPMMGLPVDYLFVKPIVVDDAMDRSDAMTVYEGDILSPETEYDLSFFPEGGNLVAGTPQRVVFVSKDRNGLPVSVEGVVLNRRQDTIVSAKSELRGYGEFLLIADPVDVYEFVTREGRRFQLPEVSGKPALRVVAHGGQCRYVIAGLTGEARLSVSQGGGELLSVQVPADHQWGMVDVSQLCEGVLCFQLQNAVGDTLSERQFFLLSDRQPAVRLTVDGDSLRIQSDDRLRGDFVLRITPKNAESNLLLRTGIRSELLLCSELGAPLVYPERALKHPEYIDRVLIASRFRCINPIPTEPELQESVEGKVSGARAKGILFYGQPLDSLYSIDLDKEGRFAIDLPDFAGQSEFYIQPVLKNNKSVLATVELREEPLPEVVNRYKMLSLLDLELTDPVGQQGARIGQAGPLSIHYIDRSGLRTLRVGEVTVRGRRQKSAAEAKVHYKALKLMGDDVFKYSNFNIASAVGRLVNVSVGVETDGTMGAINTRTLGSLGNSCPMQFLVDGVFREPQEALSLAPAEVKSIEKLNISEASVYGSKGFCGIVKIETYGATDRRIDGTAGESSGLSFVKMGYSPRMVDPFNEWFVSFDTIEKETTIPLPENLGSCIICLEGVTATGEVLETKITQ